jgi:hypothetical protein
MIRKPLAQFFVLVELLTVEHPTLHPDIDEVSTESKACLRRGLSRNPIPERIRWSRCIPVGRTRALSLTQHPDQHSPTRPVLLESIRSSAKARLSW